MYNRRRTHKDRCRFDTHVAPLWIWLDHYRSHPRIDNVDIVVVDTVLVAAPAHIVAAANLGAGPAGLAGGAVHTDAVVGTGAEATVSKHRDETDNHSLVAWISCVVLKAQRAAERSRSKAFLFLFLPRRVPAGSSDVALNYD